MPHETAAVSAQVLCTPYNHAPCHFMQSHIRKVYACFTGILKGNRTDEASWLENVKTVQLFPPAGSFGSSVIFCFCFVVVVVTSLLEI